MEQRVFISEYNQNNPETRGHLYQVELKPDQDEYLLWDEKLVDQSDKSKTGAEAVLDEMRGWAMVRDNKITWISGPESS